VHTFNKKYNVAPILFRQVMRCSLAMGAIWLAMASALRQPPNGRGSEPMALASAVGLELEAGVSSWPLSWRQHSHAVLRDLVAPSAAAQLARGGALEAQLDPQSLEAPSPPSEVPTRPLQSQPPQLVAGDDDDVLGAWSWVSEEHLRGWGDDERGGDLCAGRSIYDGPARGWEDCRAMCRAPCKFWSYGRGTMHHRCRLTTECGQLEVDDDEVAGAYSGTAQDAWVQGDSDPAALEKRRASSTLEPQEAAAPEAIENEVQPAPDSRQTCSPQGSASKFAVSPEIGVWHNIGIAHHYADCATAAASLGYKNLVWNIGSKSKGLCYGFGGEAPEISERSCEDTYCWLFGPACGESAGH